MTTATLQIEHAITDYPTWKAAFDRFVAARIAAGVLRHRIQHLADDPSFLVIELDFDTVDRAAAFGQFLHSSVWASPHNAPALASVPRTRILHAADD